MVTNSKRFKSKLQSLSNPILLDGALGTELERRGIELGETLWSGLAILCNSLELTQLHLDYLNSGSEILLTSTYQLSNKALSKENLNPEEIYSKSIQLCLDAQTAYYKNIINLKNQNNDIKINDNSDNKINKREIYISGSVGPYGAYLHDFLEYTGDYNNVSDSELNEYHKERFQFLHNSLKVDVIAMETIPNLQEIKVLVKLINEFNSTSTNKKCYWISFSCKKDGSLADGTSIDLLFEFLNVNCDDQLIALGANCCKLQYSNGILIKLNEKIDKYDNLKKVKLLIYPNSAEEYHDGGEWSVEFTQNDIHDEFLSIAKKCIQLDRVGIIGGCCRTRPHDIKLLRNLLDQ